MPKTYLTYLPISVACFLSDSFSLISNALKTNAAIKKLFEPNFSKEKKATYYIILPYYLISKHISKPSSDYLHRKARKGVW